MLLPYLVCSTSLMIECSTDKHITWVLPRSFYLICYVLYHRSNSISVSTRDAPQTHSWSSNITSRTLPFSVRTIPVLVRVLWHPTICKITLTLSSALHLSTDSIQHMYTHPRSQIMVMHRAHMYHMFSFPCHTFVSYILHATFIIPHVIYKSSTCSLPFITCYVSSSQYISFEYLSCIFLSFKYQL